MLPYNSSTYVDPQPSTQTPAHILVLFPHPFIHKLFFSYYLFLDKYSTVTHIDLRLLPYHPFAYLIPPFLIPFRSPFPSGHLVLRLSLQSIPWLHPLNFSLHPFNEPPFLLHILIFVSSFPSKKKTSIFKSFVKIFNQSFSRFTLVSTSTGIWKV